MKKVFKFGLLALFLGIMSCEDATDIIQPSEMSEEDAFTTVEHLQQGLNGVYGAYSPDAGSNGAGYDAILFNDLFTDNLKRGFSNSGQGNQEYSFILQPLSDFPTTIWSNRYATINFANRVLRAWDRIYPNLEGAERTQAEQIKGQLLGLRALCHLDLMMYFTEDYQDLTSPSIIIMDFVPEINQVFPRNTVAEVYDFIEADLDAATDLIGGFNVAAENHFFLSEDALLAMRARMYITKGDYALAGTIAAGLLVSHPLAGLDDYSTIWDDSGAPAELIFTLSRRTASSGITALYSANGPGREGSPFFEASNELYFSYSDDDIRKQLFFFPEDEETGSVIISPDSPDNIILINKYPGSAEGDQVNDVKIFRSSEMQLILAESQARAGNLDAAEQTVRQLRITRSISGTAPLPTYNTLEDALEDILLERRKEFAFEGHRYLDLKRLGEEIGEGISRPSVDCASFSAPCDLLPGDYRFTLPIPRSEINANPSIQQNTGY